MFRTQKLNVGVQSFIGKSSELERYLNTFDLVMVGSDQVWNYENTSFDKVYFLDFRINKFRKISYAASFGRDNIPEKIQSEIINLLESFDMIGVRESSGKRIINSKINKQVSVTLDPTLLLSSKEWYEEFPLIRKPKVDKYLLVYTIGHDKNLDKVALLFAAKNDLKLVRIMRDFRDEFRLSEKHKNPNVEEFLSLINNASYIITNSFHGVAFSVNFKKISLCILIHKIRLIVE